MKYKTRGKASRNQLHCLYIVHISLVGFMLPFVESCQRDCIICDAFFSSTEF